LVPAPDDGVRRRLLASDCGANRRAEAREGKPALQRPEVTMRWLAGIALFFALASPAIAVQPDEIPENPTLEARARALHRSALWSASKTVDRTTATRRWRATAHPCARAPP